jgi:hypothetical protein
LRRDKKVVRPAAARSLVGVAIDVAAVVVFVLVGRHVHGHNLNIDGMTSTLWPFLCGLSVGWLIVVAGRRSGPSLAAGVVVGLTTVTLGMTLRVISGQGTVPAFIAVALGYFAVTMLGWRLVNAALRRRSR